MKLKTFFFTDYFDNQYRKKYPNNADVFKNILYIFF